MSSALLSVRVMVEDVWDEVHLDVAPSTPLGDLKAMALYEAGVKFPPEDYVLKFRGAELQDEDRSVADAGVMAHATLIVLPRRRRPLR